jgi:thymidine kinase
MLQISDIHTDLVGKLCKITSFGIELEKEYVQLFGVGNVHTAQMAHLYCYNSSEKYAIKLMFIDEVPFFKNGMTWYFLKSVGKYANGDYYLYTLDQLLISD